MVFNRRPNTVLCDFTSPVEQRYKTFGSCDHIHHSLQYLLWQSGGALSLIGINTPAALYGHLQRVSQGVQFLCQTAQSLSSNAVCLRREDRECQCASKYICVGLRLLFQKYIKITVHPNTKHYLDTLGHKTFHNTNIIYTTHYYLYYVTFVQHWNVWYVADPSFLSLFLLSLRETPLAPVSTALCC